MDELTLTPYVEDIGFAEALRWHDGELWFADSHRRVVCRCGADGSVSRIHYAPGQPCGMGWLPNGELVVVSMWDRNLLVTDEGRLRRYARVNHEGLGPLNDMVVDAKGRCYVGSIEYDLLTPDPLATTQPPSKLMLVDSDGELTCVAEDVYFPNGMALSADQRLLVLSETAVDRLTAFDVADNGQLLNRRTFGTLPTGSGPDGIAMDAEGAVWAACYNTGEFYRVEDGLGITAVIPADPDRIAIACAVGGMNNDVLFCSTAAKDMTARQTSTSGRIETVSIGRPVDYASKPGASTLGMHR